MEHGIFTVTHVEVVAPHTLKLAFDDGVTQIIDFSSILKGELLGALQEISLFNQVSLDPEVGTIVWPNGADFDPATLHDWNIYEGEFVAHANKCWAKVAEDHDEYTVKQGTAK